MSNALTNKIAVSGMARASQVSKLEEVLKKELNTTTCKSLGFASGGCINEGQGYDTDHGKIFVKLNEGSEVTLTFVTSRGESPSGRVQAFVLFLPRHKQPKFWFSSQAKKMFEGEFVSLEAICQTNTLRVPKPIKVLEHPSGSGAVFVLEHLEMKGLRKYQSELGTQLARLHLDNIKKLQNAESEKNRIGKNQDLTAVEKFGFPTTTCCGYIAQDNEWHDDWVAFYTKCRLQHQVDLIEKEYSDSDARSLWSRLKPKIPEFFKDVDVKPSLLHGDLWSGNVAETDDGPVTFDPASFYGHHEFDLAIAGMFGGFSRAFYDAYHKEIPKQKGFDKRHQLYQLFHHLNHWNHFGTSYKSSSLQIMRGLLENC